MRLLKQYVTRTKFIALVSIIIALAILSGCATSKGTIDTFYESSYEPGSIKTLAVPRMRNAQLAPSQSQQIGRRLNQAILKKNPKLNIMSANSFNNFLNKRGIVDQYADFIDDYITSGIANEEFTGILRRNEVDGVLISSLTRIKQEDGEVGYSGHDGETRVTLSFAVIDTDSNQIIWSASADGIKGTYTRIGSAPPIAKAVDLAMEKVVSSVPKL